MRSYEHMPIHAHASYAHIILQMWFIYWAKFEPNVYAKILHQCVVSFIWVKPIKWQPLTILNTYQSL
jgi:hypothetical protein